MDPLSATGSVIACVQICSSILSACVHYIHAVKDAQNDLRNIMIEIGSLKCVLEVLNLVSSQGDGLEVSAIQQKFEGRDNPVHGCQRALVALQELFPKEEAVSATDGKRRKLNTSYRSLAWPL